MGDVGVGETPGVLGTTFLHHVGIVVQDLDRAAEAFSQLVGLPVPPAREYDPDGLRRRAVRYRGTPIEGGTRAVSFVLENVLVDLLEPVGGATPWRDSLDAHGPGVDHVAFVVDDVGRVLAELEARGYPTIQSGRTADGGRYGYVDTYHALGVAIEVLPGHAMLPPFETVPGGPSALGTRRLAQIGVVAEDVGRVAGAWGELLGLEAPPVRTPQTHPARNLRYLGQPSGGESKRTTFQLENIRLEVVEPVGAPTAWQAMLDERGIGVHHFAFEAPDRVPPLRRLADLGYAELHFGEFAEGTYTYVDSRADFGLNLEVIERAST